MSVPVLEALPDNHNFRLLVKNFALTYKTHLPKDDLHAFVLSAAGKPGMARVVHEIGATGYEHTHVLVMLNAKPDIKNAHKFDYQVDGDLVHPNIQPIKSAEHLANWRKYVDKSDPDPVGELPAVKAGPEEKFSAATEHVLNCQRWADVFKGPVEIQMTICSKIPYFKMLWETNAKKKTTVTKYSNFTANLLDLSEKNWLVSGKAGTGKTAWALSHFKNGVMVSHIDDLKNITPETDGIVFDDMSFKHWAPESIIHLLDREHDRSIHCRYTNAEIPAGLPKIFTHNRDDIFISEKGLSDEQEAAVRRRYNHFAVRANLF